MSKKPTTAQLKILRYVAKGLNGSREYPYTPQHQHGLRRDVWNRCIEEHWLDGNVYAAKITRSGLAVLQAVAGAADKDQVVMANRRFTVFFSGKTTRKIMAIKAIFRYTHLGLRESKALLDQTVEIGVEGSVETTKKKNAMALVQELKEMGFEARYKTNTCGLCLVGGDTEYEKP